MKVTRKLHPGEVTTVWLLLVFSLFVLYQAYRITGFSGLSSAGAFPLAAAFIMSATALYLVFDNLRLAHRQSADDHHPAWLVINELMPLRIVLFTALIVAYMLLLQPLGFLFSTFLFLCSGFIYLRGSTPLRSVLIAAVAVAVIYGLFHYLFRVVLP
ncbi:tripartite tricarboxylate transporter TctB family protein [Marinobacterium sedimentorum]|uniref:tripartite tricarboxylate transporter TctB family protein n=1 Tax=Marinobacterium sedimentorum TaxID=2927804 RepID=UPI0020C7154C|nr:tripartite tricarboxylate transporter TctB family protein [Marinobacterium sedimentorum]MCP8687598.1 tripartite tricarboxylate transporter TctB family protein [Marinobacterium sedimentorum]